MTVFGYKRYNQNISGNNLHFTDTLNLLKPNIVICVLTHNSLFLFLVSKEKNKNVSCVSFLPLF